MKQRKICGIVTGIVCVVCIILVIWQCAKDPVAEEKNAENSLGVTIKKVDDEEYDITKNYYKDYDDTNLETYMITAVFSDEETYIKGIRDAGVCKYIYKNEDGNAEIKVTEEQRKEWLSKAKENIETVLEKLKDDEACSFQINEDYTELNAKITKQCSAQKFLSDVEVIMYNSEIMQMFTGSTDWSVHFVVQNKNTGYELVNVQYPKEEWSISPESWDE